MKIEIKAIQGFGVATFRSKAKLHLTSVKNGNLVSSCYNSAGDWVGKPIQKIVISVEHEVKHEADDVNRAIEALYKIRPDLAKNICLLCHWTKFF